MIFGCGQMCRWHRLLCHSLVRSEIMSTVDCQRSIEEQTVQECDATKASCIFNYRVPKKIFHRKQPFFYYLYCSSGNFNNLMQDLLYYLATLHLVRENNL